MQSASFAFSLASFVAGLLQQQPAPAPGTDGSRRGALPLLSLGLSAALPALIKPSGGVPQGYVRLLVFDADSNLVSQQVQTRQLSAAAASGYEPLAVQVVAQQDGYVTAYVGNESNADVYFDDVQVTLGQGLQVQENSYDPYGLSLAGLDYTSPGANPSNKYQFNGKEQERELGLNWQDFNWRHYDPATARFFGVDRLADKFVYMTDYQFASNNPASKIELDGLEGIDAKSLFVKSLFAPGVSSELRKASEAGREVITAKVGLQVVGIGFEFKSPLGKGKASLAAGAVEGRGNGKGKELELNAVKGAVGIELVGYGGSVEGKAASVTFTGEGSETKNFELSPKVERGNVSASNGELSVEGKLGVVTGSISAKLNKASEYVDHVVEAGKEYLTSVFNGLTQQQYSHDAQKNGQDQVLKEQNESPR